MIPHYFKPDTPIATRCEHCGTQRQETLGDLCSSRRLICARCGKEHTPDRNALRQQVEQTEALLDRIPAWMEKALAWLDRRA